MRAFRLGGASTARSRAKATAAAAFLLAFWTFGCSTSTAPSERVTIRVEPQPDVVFVGASVSLTVTNAATGAAVQPLWSTSDATVAVVSAGELRALRPGVVTIGALYQASNVTFVVKVVPNFAGTYDGTMFIVEQCFFDRGVCSPPLFPGTIPARFIARWTQVKDVVSGTLSFPSNASDHTGPIQGQIDTAGRLTVTGRLVNTVGAPILFTDLEEWSTFLNEAGTQMFGTFVMRDMVRDVPQSVRRAELRGIDRVP